MTRVGPIFRRHFAEIPKDFEVFRVAMSGICLERSSDHHFFDSGKRRFDDLRLIYALLGVDSEKLKR